MRVRTKILCLGSVILLAALWSAGCATKKYVQQETAAVDKKVEQTQTEIEANQKRLKEHDERIATLGTLITQAQGQIKDTDSKIEQVRKEAQGTLVSKAVLQSNDATFKFDSSELAPEAKAILDKFVQDLVAQNRGLYIEIQGHTDSTGPESYNETLGQKRAEAVMLYLYKQYHIPLYRMQVISMGATTPIADNATKEGRAKNRRVEILVYE